MTHSISAFSLLTTALGCECVDITHLPSLPSTLRNENTRIFAVRIPKLTENRRKPRPLGTRLNDVIEEFENTPEGAMEMAESRQWVAGQLYADEAFSLQALRLKLGLSQSELARNIGTTQARISIYERGAEKPEFDMMLRMKNVLGVDMNQLASAIEYAAKRRESING